MADDCQVYDADIASLARRMRDGTLGPVEVARDFLERIGRLDGRLGAFRLLCPERAMAEARNAETRLRGGSDLGPLQGIPYAVKDLFDVTGLPTCVGTRLKENTLASEDAFVVRRLARAGMVLLGKTNTVQFAYGGVGINHDHGTPHNPWHPVPHVPGGSSSGSAVAVAAGMVPLALGTDTGGSVRIPAALCGAVGLKTTVGRISRAGVYPLSWSLDSVGALVRTVQDAALVYQVLQGADPQDPPTLGTPAHDVLGDLKAGVRGLRLAFAEPLFGGELDPGVEKAVRLCGDVFKDLGAQVEHMDLPVVTQAMELSSQGRIVAAEAYTINAKWVEEHFDALDPVVADRIAKGKRIRAFEYLQDTFRCKELRAKALCALEGVDALLAPATPLPALPVSRVDADARTYFACNTAYLRNTSVGNLLDLCALSVPCGFTGEGLPVGLMIYGKPFREDMVLRVGHAYQQVTDWHMRRPDLTCAQQEA